MAKLPIATEKTPAALGYSMPAEWENHEATWLAWPHNPTDWPGKINTIRWVYGEMVRKISPGEIVRLLVNSQAERGGSRAGRSRAPAPISAGSSSSCIPRTEAGRATAARFLSAAAAGHPKPPSSISISTPGPGIPTGRRIAPYPEWPPRRLKKPLFNAALHGRDFVLEGGGIDVNGRGTLLTTEECLPGSANPGAQSRPLQGRRRNRAQAQSRREQHPLARPRRRGRRHARARRRHLPIRQSQDRGAGPGKKPPGHQLPPAGREPRAHCRTCGSRTARKPRSCRCPCRRRSTSTAIGCRRATRISTSATPR